jgi:hypothetical protein
MLPKVTHLISTGRKQPFDMLQQKQARLGKGLEQKLGGSADAKALNTAVTSEKVAHLDFLTRGADSTGRTLTHTSSNSPSATRIKFPVTLARKMPILSWKGSITPL